MESKGKNIPKLRFPGFEGEWEVKKLGEIGNTYSGLSGKTKEDFESGNAKFITFMNVLKNTKINTDILGQVNVGTNERQNEVFYGDMLFNTSSETPEEVGFCSVYDTKFYQAKVYLNSFCFGYRFKDISKYDPLFLAYYFRSNHGRKLMFKIAQGITRFNLSKEHFYKCSIPFPTLPEQQKIASCLSSLDGQISAEQSRLESLSLHKRGLIQQLFPQEGETVPKLRFPGFEGDWKVKKLGEISSVFQGYGFPEKYQGKTNGDIPFYKVSDISFSTDKGNKYILDAKNYIDKETLPLLHAKLIHIGSTVFAKIGEAIRKNNRAITKVPCLIDNNAAAIKAKENISLDEFLFYTMSQIELINYAGGVVPAVTKTAIESIQVPIPTLPEQQKIVSCLTAIDDLIAAQQERIEALKQHKRGLMQQLFPAVANE